MEHLLSEERREVLELLEGRSSKDKTSPKNAQHQKTYGLGRDRRNKDVAGTKAEIPTKEESFTNSRSHNFAKMPGRTYQNASSAKTPSLDPADFGIPLPPSARSRGRKHHRSPVPGPFEPGIPSSLSSPYQPAQSTGLYSHLLPPSSQYEPLNSSELDSVQNKAARPGRSPYFSDFRADLCDDFYDESDLRRSITSEITRKHSKNDDKDVSIKIRNTATLTPKDSTINGKDDEQIQTKQQDVPLNNFNTKYHYDETVNMWDWDAIPSIQEMEMYEDTTEAIEGRKESNRERSFNSIKLKGKAINRKADVRQKTQGAVDGSKIIIRDVPKIEHVDRRGLRGVERKSSRTTLNKSQDRPTYRLLPGSLASFIEEGQEQAQILSTSSSNRDFLQQDTQQERLQARFQPKLQVKNADNDSSTKISRKTKAHENKISTTIENPESITRETPNMIDRSNLTSFRAESDTNGEASSTARLGREMREVTRDSPPKLVTGSEEPESQHEASPGINTGESIRARVKGKEDLEKNHDISHPTKGPVLFAKGSQMEEIDNQNRIVRSNISKPSSTNGQDPSISTVLPIEVDEALITKAGYIGMSDEMKTEIYQRCQFLDPPISPKILSKLPSFQEATGDMYSANNAEFFTSLGWKVLEMKIKSDFNNYNTMISLPVAKNKSTKDYRGEARYPLKHPSSLKNGPFPIPGRGAPMDEGSQSIRGQIIRGYFSNTASMASTADSIFSYASISSMTSVTDPVSAKERLVTLLLSDNIIHPLCTEALTTVAPDQFVQNLHRKLEEFAVNLRIEAKDDQERKTAQFMRLRARSSARMMYSQLKKQREINEHKTTESLNLQMEVDDLDSDDNNSDQSEDEVDDLPQLELFIKKSKAIKILGDELRLFLYPPAIVIPRVSTIEGGEEQILDKSTKVMMAIDKDTIVESSMGKSQTRKPILAGPIASQGNRNRVWNWLVTEHLTNLLITVGICYPRPAVGKTRIQWRCKCGHEITDDFTEVSPGGLDRYRQMVVEAGPSSTASSTGTLLGRIKNLGSVFSSGKNPPDGLGEGLPMHTYPTTNLAVSTTTRVIPTTPTPSQDLLFLLLCYSEGRYATRLLQLDLVALNASSDKVLFALLRTNYYSMRKGWASWISLKTLIWIKFVHFEMYRSELVDVRKVNDIPPPDHAGYKYAPVPPDVIPPVGDRHMMHLFQYPECAEDEPLCLSRFPKKLKEKLKSQSGINPGWGLQFVEDWDFKKLWIAVFVFFGLGSLVIAFSWAVLKHSIQDAFAIAAYMVAFATLTLGLMQALLVM